MTQWFIKTDNKKLYTKLVNAGWKQPTKWEHSNGQYPDQILVKDVDEQYDIFDVIDQISSEVGEQYTYGCTCEECGNDYHITNQPKTYFLIPK